MKIVLPIVGRDDNNNNNGYNSSLYEIERKTIFQYVYEFLNQIEDAEFIVIIRRDDVIKYHFDDMIRLLIPGVEIVIADGHTSGSACSCLLAVDKISEEEPLIIAGADQLYIGNPQEAVIKFKENEYDGGIIIFEDIHPKWSYVKLNKEGFVIEAAEKRPISKNATTGFYYFKHGRDFIDSAKKMIKKFSSVNGQYYVCPTYNEMILEQKKIGVYRITKNLYFNFKQANGIKEYEKFLKI